MNDPTPPLILIVDDEASNRKLLETLLRPAGYDTRSAASGTDALAAIEHNAPDLILLDVMMPGINGYELAGILKARVTTSQIPIIMVTALIDRAARVAGLNAGAEEFISKPVDRGELWLRVRNLLRLKALGDMQREIQEQLARLNATLEEKVQLRTAQLEDANKELEAFSYSVAHDLRAPLSSINGFSHLLGAEIAVTTEASARAKHYLARIRAGALQMSRLIDALLALAGMSHAAVHRKQVDMSALAATVLDALREREPGRTALLEVQPGLVARGDALLLHQVMENLLGNAWKFSGREPLVRIAFSRSADVDGEQVYTVRDSGAGFDMAYSAKLFGPFQRLHTQSEFPGTGIGLATVQRIVQRHDGKVWAESSPGQGAAFHFTLEKPTS